ncbi:MAG: TonB-dependent receptor, partial [Prevotellaceae bacterium]|nr:TonB-dependent receptor [Prevotellaceae bacterium]
MTKKKMTLLAVLSAFVMNAEAQSEKTEKTVDLNPVTVTGTGTYHKADNTPIAVKVITAKELKDAQASSLQDALSKLSSDITTSTNG